MKKKIFGTWCLALAASAILFALQTAAQSVVTYHSKDVEESKEYIKGNEYQKDFLLFMDMLQSTHPAFEKNAPLDMKKELKQGYARFGKCQNPQSFAVQLQQIAARLHDEHTAVCYFQKEKLMYPAHFYADESGYYLNSVQRGLEPCLGKRIVKVNGREMKDVCERFRPFYSANNEAGFSKQFEKQAFYFSPWQEMGLCEADSTITLTFSDDTTLRLFPWGVDFKDWAPLQVTPSPVAVMRQQGGGMPFTYQITDGGICYLLFDQCMDREDYRQMYMPQVAGNDMMRARLEQQLKRIPVFTEFLDSMFADMKQRNVRTLAVDVRRNSGGNSLLCNELLCWLKSAVATHGVYPRASALATESYQLQGKDPSVLKESYPSHTLQGLEHPFDGDVIWIQGKETFSSAGILMTLAVDNNIGKVIGEPASYAPTHYGDLLYWTLPNTQTSGQVSHKYFVRPDEKRGNEIPLVETLPTSFQDYQKGTDPCYEWVKANYGR